MTTIDAAILAELKLIAPAAKVVAEGATVSEKVDPLITFVREGSEHSRHMTAGAGLVKIEVGIDLYSRKRRTVSDLANTLRERLDNLRGSIGAPAAELNVQAIFVDGIDFFYEPDRSGGAAGWHRARVPIIVWTAESKTPIPE